MCAANLYVSAKGIVRICVILVNHIYFLTYLTWILIFYPLRIFGYNDLFDKIEGQMTLGLIKMIAMWNEWAHYEVLEAGDDITSCLEERTLLLVNHQSEVDFMMLCSAFIGNNQILPNAMWIMDNFIKYSTVGIVSSIRKDFFIFQGKEKRKESLEALAAHLRNSYLPLKRKWLILFPEGGFLYKRKEKSQKYGRLNNLPHLEYVIIPREGALKVILNGLNVFKSDNSSSEYPETHQLKYIMDVTIGYPGGKPLSISNVLFGNHPPCKIIIFYRLYSINTLPQDEEGFSKWLLSRWVEKEKMLEEFYSSGNFPLGANGKTPKRVKQNFLSYCALHVAFLTSTFVQYIIFILLYQYCFTW